MNKYFLFYLKRYSVIDRHKSSIRAGNTDVLQKLRDSKLSSSNAHGNRFYYIYVIIIIFIFY